MVANYGRAFGMRVVVHDSDPMALAGLPASEVVAPSDLLAQSDVLSLHMKLNESSAGWLSTERISLLPPGAVVVNTARGGLVDEVALAAAVRSGRLSGVGVDVLTLETDRSGRVQESPLIDAATAGYNVVLTPHIGGYAVDAVGLTRSLAVELFLERLGTGKQCNDHGTNQPRTGRSR
jgi:lactate dehydrogenase-like 2-hydroxyacid dehydrogenase